MIYSEIVRFHGHECPGLANGYRMASAGLAALESQRAKDEELVTEPSTRSIDAIDIICLAPGFII